MPLNLAAMMTKAANSKVGKATARVAESKVTKAAVKGVEQARALNQGRNWDPNTGYFVLPVPSRTQAQSAVFGNVGQVGPTELSGFGQLNLDRGFRGVAHPHSFMRPRGEDDTGSSVTATAPPPTSPVPAVVMPPPVAPARTEVFKEAAAPRVVFQSPPMAKPLDVDKVNPAVIPVGPTPNTMPTGPVTPKRGVKVGTGTGPGRSMSAFYGRKG